MLLRNGLIAAAAMLAITVQPAMAETHHRQPASQPWTKLCGTDQATTKRACLTMMGARDHARKAVIVALLIDSGDDREGILRIRWSRNVRVKQLGLKNWRVRANRSPACVTDTCEAVFKVDSAFLVGLKKQRAITVWAEARDGRQLTFSLSRMGFTDEMARWVL